MPINSWWEGLPEERFWLETTDREDLGANLLAPQEDEAGVANASYVLVTHVRDGDIVLHYHTKEGAIVGWSRAVGGYWEGKLVWASHAGERKAPRERLAWEHGLDGPYRFATPITLQQLRDAGAAIAEVQGGLRAAHRGPLYFPMEVSKLRPTRATQFYMTKWPAALVEVIPGLREQIGAALVVHEPSSQVAPATHLPFEPADENSTVTPPDPFFVDPAVVERGIAGHARTLNQLAAAVETHGARPLRHGPEDPAFDLAWTVEGTLFVAEVKSITDANEERQLRLGLGQVLRYRHLLEKPGQPVVAVLAAEREPGDEGWKRLCASLGVRLVWPETMNQVSRQLPREHKG